MCKGFYDSGNRKNLKSCNTNSKAGFCVVYTLYSEPSKICLHEWKSWSFLPTHEGLLQLVTQDQLADL